MYIGGLPLGWRWSQPPGWANITGAGAGKHSGGPHVLSMQGQLLTLVITWPGWPGVSGALREEGWAQFRVPARHTQLATPLPMSLAAPPDLGPL